MAQHKSPALEKLYNSMSFGPDVGSDEGARAQVLSERWRDYMLTRTKRHQYLAQYRGPVWRAQLTQVVWSGHSYVDRKDAVNDTPPALDRLLMEWSGEYLPQGEQYMKIVDGAGRWPFEIEPRVYMQGHLSPTSIRQAAARAAQK